MQPSDVYDLSFYMAAFVGFILALWCLLTINADLEDEDDQ